VKVFDAGKTRMIGLPYGEKNCDDMLRRFCLIPERNGQMDRHSWCQSKAWVRFIHYLFVLIIRLLYKHPY